MAYAGGIRIYSEDGGATWNDDTSYNLWFEQYGDQVTTEPRDYYISGYRPRYQRRQIIGYHSASGDLRSIEVTASGELRTDTGAVEISGQTVVIESGLGVITAGGIQVSGTVQVSGDVSISGNVVSISGNLFGFRGTTRIRTGNVILVTSASGGQSMAVSGQWCSGEVHNVSVKCFSGNLDVYIGGSGCKPYSGYGYPLSMNETKDIDIGDIQLIYLCASQSGQKVGYMGTDY